MCFQQEVYFIKRYNWLIFDFKCNACRFFFVRLLKWDTFLWKIAISHFLLVCVSISFRLYFFSWFTFVWILGVPITYNIHLFYFYFFVSLFPIMFENVFLFVFCYLSSELLVTFRRWDQEYRVLFFKICWFYSKPTKSS